MDILARFVLLFFLLLPNIGNTQTDPAQLADSLAQKKHTEDLDDIRKRKQIRALVTYSPTDFALMDDGKPQGIQVDLLHDYEKFLNKSIRQEVDKTHIVFIPTTFDRLIPDLLEGKGDIAAALLTITSERKKEIAFATGGALNVNEVVVTHKDVTGINKVSDLAGREIYVLKNSSYVEHLQDFNEIFKSKGLKAMMIKEADSHLLSEDILDMVNAGIVPVTVIDDYKAELWGKVLPDIRVLPDVKVTSNGSVGWGLRKNNPKLIKHLNSYAKTVKKAR